LEKCKIVQTAKHLAALNSTGFISVRIEEKDYRRSSSIQGYLASRKISLQGRFLQNQWEEAKWLHFLDSVEEEFRFRFQEPLKFTTSVIFGIGQKRLLC
jgi:hypothetical protein